MEKNILIIGAMEDVELDYLKSRLNNSKKINYNGFNFYKGTMFEKNIVICSCDIGTINAATAMTIAIEKYTPRAIINNGLSGGYTSQLKKGEIVVGLDAIDITSLECKGNGNRMEDYEITTFQHGKENEIMMPKADTTIIKLIKEKLADEKLHFGRMASGNIWNKNKKRIEYINQRYGAICEDMESIAIYKVANIYKVPAVSIRGISNNEILEEKYDYSVSHKLQKLTEKLIEII